MRGLIQRVTEASVAVGGETIGEIGPGLLVLLGVERGDEQAQADRMMEKLLGYRIFPDVEGRMNRSVTAVGGGVLLVSQFTLVADTSRGMRPGFSAAADPRQAEQLYDYLCRELLGRCDKFASGRFAANMQVALVNDGPVTFLLEVPA